MDLRPLLRLVIVWIALSWTSLAHAQDLPAEWTNLASRAEVTVTNDESSLFALNRLRNNLITWRKTFAEQRDANAGRLATLDAQLAALGPAKDDGGNPQIALRRALIERQRAEEFAPTAFAQEAFARADGLIREVDTRIFELERAALTTRGMTPLNPVNWFSATQSFGSALQIFGNEVVSGLQVGWQNGFVQSNAPVALGLIVVGFVLMTQSARRTARLRRSSTIAGSEWRPIYDFLLSLAQLVLPLVGLWAVIGGVQRLDVLSATGTDILRAIGQAGALIIVARWLSAAFFPKGGPEGPLGFDHLSRRFFRQLGIIFGIGLSLITLIEAIMTSVDAPSINATVLAFPIVVVLSVALFRFGQMIGGPASEFVDGEGTWRLRKFFGTLSIIVAVAAPLLSALGYKTGYTALLQPFIMTIALTGFVMLLQQLVNALWSLMRQDDDEGAGPLAPVLIGILLGCLALPVLALIWGAGSSDLREVWTRFQTGLTFGETTLSPTDFLWFLIIFAVGYLLTRLVQSALRNNVLPRTKLDLGGRNAIVAGVGYVGIILAAVIAITSAGIDLTNLALVAGALSVGIGFGLQTIVSNFVSGIILLIERPVSEGDWIEVNGQAGYVRDISVRSTRIETFDRSDVIIPNADLLNNQVTNLTRDNSVGRVIVPVGVAYGTDAEKVREILKNIAMAHPMVLHNPEPNVLFQAFGASSLDFEIRALLRDINFGMSVKSELNTEIAKQFAAEGIEIPFPQRDVWLKNAPGADKS